MDAPTYKQPQLDPSYGPLMQQSKDQDIAAVKAGVAQDTRSETARFGTLTSGDSASLLARYGLQLAMANSGAGALAKINGGI